MSEMHDVEEICAFLTTKACPKEMFPELEYDDHLRAKVQETLDRAGYEFVDDPISKHYDARIKSRIREMSTFMEDQLGSIDLTVQAKALLVILWCYLVLPKYDRNMRKQLREEPTVSEDQLYENFKLHIGSKQNLRRVLTVLRQYDFVRTVWGKNELKAGPRLTTSLDSFTMYNRLKDRLIDFIGKEYESEKQSIVSKFDQLLEQIEGDDSHAKTN